MTTVENILEQAGPLMSGELSKRLAKVTKTPINSASQKISRNKEIRKIKGFFKSNQSLCFLEKQYQNGQLYNVFSKSLFEYGKKYWYCLNAINMHGGIISTKFLECYTNYPIQKLKKHIPFKEVMQKFVREGVLLFNDDKYLFAPRFAPLKSNSLIHKTIETIKEDILSSFESLMKNMGMISFNTGEQFAEYGKFRWSFKGVSYLRGLVVNSNPGFVLADILFGHQIQKQDVLFFIEKLNHIQSFKNASKVIPFVIVDDLHPEALALLKSNGVAIGFIKELFSNKYAEALKELVAVLSNAGASLKTTPNKYLELIEELKIYNETLIYNIRGTLFEYFVGHIHSRDCQSIDIGREIYENNGKHEIDVFAIYSDKVVFAECKATNSKVEYSKVNKWISEKIPAFKTWAQKQEILKNKKLEFEYWSTSGFDKKGEEKLNKFITSTKKFKVSSFSNNQIRKRAVDMKNKKMKEALDNYFLKIMV